MIAIGAEKVSDIKVHRVSSTMCLGRQLDAVGIDAAGAVGEIDIDEL
jgi:hypothetical protein